LQAASGVVIPSGYLAQLLIVLSTPVQQKGTFSPFLQETETLKNLPYCARQCNEMQCGYLAEQWIVPLPPFAFNGKSAGRPPDDSSCKL
jgi:hypothetical protein